MKRKPQSNLLLHSCCAPCSVSVTDALRDDNIESDLFWYNPNIHPALEYSLRLNSLKEFAANENLKLRIHGEYGLRIFINEKLAQTENRCQKCYLMRLEKTASIAAQEGYNAFSTTLLISPYQDHETIKRLGEEAASKYGIEFFYRDFRPLFRKGQTAARASGFYMQKYCGCIFSEEERYSQNTSRKELSKKKKNHRGHGVTRSIREFLSLFSVKLRGKSNLLDSSRNSEYSNIYSKTLRNSAPPCEIFSRLSLLTGNEGLEKLKKTSVLIFGAGGVGSWAAEALVRSGIGKIGIIDHDIICASNINRQVEATSLTIGMPKASALKKYLLEINPDCEITAWDELFCRENASKFNIENSCYVIDAIDTLNHKLDLIETVFKARAQGSQVTLFSSMGMALKLDPSQIKKASIWDTQNCPLARNVRQGLRKCALSSAEQFNFTVVYSAEPPKRAGTIFEQEKKPVNGSIVTVTATAGFLLASLVINNIVIDKIVINSVLEKN
ncbi:MAG: epoxyqueuosine reductase QueH [Treponema sp.]|nr:epoxyqueuosine reductase QueH [Treponema sp.]